jgi:hypothetical protein
MPKERKPATSENRKKLNKKPKMFRLPPDTIRKLDIAAHKAGMSESVYVDLALKAQLKKDGVE